MFSTDSQRLNIAVMAVSSEDALFPARDLVHQAACGMPRGWKSAPNASYPQSICIGFSATTSSSCANLLQQIQVLTHGTLVPTRVEVHLCEMAEGSNNSAAAYSAGASSDLLSSPFVVPVHSAVFRYAGYISFRKPDDNPATMSSAGEIRTIRLQAHKVLYVKLLFYEPHPHPLNPFQQVALMSLTAVGVPHVQVHNGGPSSLRDKPEMPSLYRQLLGQYDRVSNNTSIELSSDPEVLKKIAEFEESKRKAVAVEDYESARRIRDQLDELVPLALVVHDLEHRKAKSIVEENYPEAQRLKNIIVRIRSYLAALKPGMPYQRLDLEAAMHAPSGSSIVLQNTANPADPSSGSILQTTSSPLRSSTRKMSWNGGKGGSGSKLVPFDERPIGGTRSSADLNQSSSPSPGESSGVLLIPDLPSGRDREAAQCLRKLLPSSASNSHHPEVVSDATACDINGWQRMVEVFGIYVVSCLMSKKLPLRETAVNLLLKIWPSNDNETFPVSTVFTTIASTPAKHIREALLYAMLLPQCSLNDTVNSVFLSSTEIVKCVFSTEKIATEPLVRTLTPPLITALVAKLGDSNSKVRAAAESALQYIADAAGHDKVCASLFQAKPKNAWACVSQLHCIRHALKNATWGSIPQLHELHKNEGGGFYKKFLHPLIGHANKEVRQEAIEVLAMFVKELGDHNEQVKFVLTDLKSVHLEKLKTLLGDEVPSLSKSGASPKSKGKGKQADESNNDESPVLLESKKRRTLAETAAKYPDLAEVYIFTDNPLSAQKDSGKKGEAISTKGYQLPKKLQTLDQKRSRMAIEPLSPQLISPVTGPASPLKSILSPKFLFESPGSPSFVGVGSPSPFRTSNSSFRSVSHNSDQPTKPPRRVPPAPIPGRCQFCHQASELFEQSRDELLHHYFCDCPMLCTCPLCKLPVEIVEIHWHMAEDCQHKDLVRQCSRCYECFSHDEYQEHTMSSVCRLYSNTKIICPLCREELHNDRVFWDAHYRYHPFCSQNPRTIEVDDEEEEEEGEEERQDPQDNDEQVVDSGSSAPPPPGATGATAPEDTTAPVLPLPPTPQGSRQSSLGTNSQEPPAEEAPMNPRLAGVGFEDDVASQRSSNQSSATLVARRPSARTGLGTLDAVD